MNFTREPIIESVITPKEGFRLVVRNSKGGHEEFFVDAIEVVTFGNFCFYRSLEKPKCFLVPVSDYEVLEVRESRMVLKTSSTEKGIKIGGGRETLLKAPKEEVSIPDVDDVVTSDETKTLAEQKGDKKRERRRYRKKRGKAEGEEEGDEGSEEPFFEEQKERKVEKHSLIPPPSTLISESISRYKMQSNPEPIEDEGDKRTHILPPPPLPLTIEENDDVEIIDDNDEIPF